MLTASGGAPAARAGARPSAPAALWPALVIFGVSCLAYLGAADVYFLKDDLAMSTITDAAGRPDFATLVHNFVWPATMTHDQFYRPLPIVFAWFDLTMFGVDPAGFRVCNIGFHALNAVLLAIFVNQLTRFRRPAAGWFAGLLFGLHPLHGEAVLWITQRMVVQCASFSLLALIALESFFQTRKPTAIAACVVASLAAALCKEVAVVLPGVMVVLALTRPAASARERIRRALVVGAFAALLSIAVLVTRRVIFGVWVGTYGMLSAADYAREFRIFERLPRSILDGFWAVNSLEAATSVRLAFGIGWLAFLAIALIRLIRGLSDRDVRRAATVLLAFALVSFLPTLGIFYIEPSLTNGRFLYQPMLGVIGLLLAGFTAEHRARPLLRFGAPAALAILFALAEQINLRAYFGADDQIRSIRSGIEREVARLNEPPVVIVYRVPTEFHGVVTLDASLALAMRPPFTAPPGLDVYPLIAGLEQSWPNQLPALRTWLSERPGRPILHLVCSENPVRVSPLVGALDGPAGESPPTVLAPADGAIVLHPAESPTFAFQPVSGAQKWRLSLLLSDKRFVLELDPAKNLKRVATRFEYQFQRGAVRTTFVEGENEIAIPDPARVWAEDSFQPPRAVAWHLEALDGDGRLLGRSATRAMVLLTTRVP